MNLLGEFRGCFTAPTFAVFCALASGFLAQTTRRTVCGMLIGARLSAVWSRHRAQRFLSHARWSPQQLSAVLARLIVGLEIYFSIIQRKVLTPNDFTDLAVVEKRLADFETRYNRAASTVQMEVHHHRSGRPTPATRSAQPSRTTSRLTTPTNLRV